MSKLNFKELKNSMAFQELCAEILKMEGCENVRGLGKGADQGVDLIFELPISSALGISTKTYIAQCKWYDQNNSVGEKEIGDVIGYSDMHNANGLLFITSSSFSGTAITKMEKIDKSKAHPYEVKYWNGFELTKKLIKYPHLISSYWYFTNDIQKKIKKDFIPKFNKSELLEKYKAPPRFQNISIDTFPEADYNTKFVKYMKDYVNKFTNKSSLVTLIDGAIGAGKTGYGWSLISELKNKGISAIGFNCATEFNHKFIDYKLYNNNNYLILYKIMEDIDCLFLDEFGLFLDEKSETRKDAINTLIQIVNNRIKNQKVTIITRCLSDEMPVSLKNFFEYIRNTFAYICVGDQSISIPAGTITENEYKKNKSKQNDSIQQAFLGKSWLLEKYDVILDDIKYCIDILQTPDEIYKERQKRFKERFGIDSNKDNDVIETLKRSEYLVHRYRNAINILKFDSFLLDIEEQE